METLITLLAAHLLGDFVLQTDWMARRKRNPAILLGHVAIITVLSLVLLGTLHWPILLAVFLMHLGVDALKAFGMKDTLQAFVIDQGLHLALIAALAAFFPEAFVDGWWPRVMAEEAMTIYLSGLSLLCGVILAIPAGGHLVGRFTQPFMEEIGEGDLQGLKRGGRYIGYLERGLVLLLVLIHQPGGIGFLIATKSILRFGEIRDGTHRKVAEYIIIGTFLSFGWALLVAAATRWAVLYWVG